MTDSDDSRRRTTLLSTGEAVDCMNAGDKPPPKYDLDVVAQVILEEAVELHPQCLTVRELALRIVADAGDPREVETAVEAIGDLRESGLFRCQDGEGVVQPTRAALRAVALLT
jgi:hypothetical protein